MEPRYHSLKFGGEAINRYHIHTCNTQWGSIMPCFVFSHFGLIKHRNSFDKHPCAETRSPFLYCPYSVLFLKWKFHLHYHSWQSHTCSYPHPRLIRHMNTIDSSISRDSKVKTGQKKTSSSVGLEPVTLQSAAIWACNSSGLHSLPAWSTPW